MQRCWSEIVVLLVSALNAMHVGARVLRGEYFYLG